MSKTIPLISEPVGIFLLVSIAWVVGAVELVDTIAHFGTQWYWFVLATIYTMTLNEIFCHRICAHKLFEINTQSNMYKILALLLTIDHAWSTLTSICLTHSIHHRYPDQEDRDPTNWRLYWHTSCSLSPLLSLYPIPVMIPDNDQFFDKQSKKFQIILDDMWTFFCEENRLILTILFWALLYFTIPVILFKVILMGRFLMSIYSMMAAIGGHTKLPLGYRNFNTNDTSYNNLVFHYLALGLCAGMLQNNHHGKLDSDPKVNWYEFDVGYYIIKLLRPFLEVKCNKPVL